MLKNIVVVKISSIGNDWMAVLARLVIPLAHQV